MKSRGIGDLNCLFYFITFLRGLERELEKVCYIWEFLFLFGREWELSCSCMLYSLLSSLPLTRSFSLTVHLSFHSQSYHCPLTLKDITTDHSFILLSALLLFISFHSQTSHNTFPHPFLAPPNCI